MPRLWLWHYFNKDAEFLTHIDTWSQGSFYEQVWSLIRLTLRRELPSTWHAWTLLLTNLTFLIAPFIALGFLAHNFIHRVFPPMMRQGVHKILITILPWIIFGVSLQLASWHGGNRYQIIHALGTFCLCFGQIRLAWLLLCIKRAEECPTKSPFNVLVTVLIGSFIMLTGLDITLLFSVPWAVFLCIMLVRMGRHKEIPFTLSRLLLRSFHAVLVSL